MTGVPPPDHQDDGVDPAEVAQQLRHHDLARRRSSPPRADRAAVPSGSTATARASSQVRHRCATDRRLHSGRTDRPWTEELVRKKLIMATTAGALTLTGLAVAVPALAEEGPTDAASSSVVERITDALSGLVTDGSLTQEQADEVATTLNEAGIGRGHGPGHGGRLDLSTAATALDLTEDELRTALEPEGTTLAQVAEDQDVPVDTLIDALVQAEQERLAAAVEEGRIAQDEADQRLADVEERVTERVNSADPGRGHGPHGEGPDRDTAGDEATED
jgi:hypothetical protein